MFCFKIDAQNFSIDHDELVITQQDTLRLFTKNITSNELMVIVDEYKKGVLDTWLDNWDKGHFFLAILNESSKEFFVYNDHMSSNDILYYADTQNVVISNDVKKIFNILNVSPEIDRDSVYEMIAFFSIVPPKTIYKNINAALLGSCLKYVPGKTIEVYKYWHPESLFKSKEKDYDNLILSVRNALIESFRDENEFEKMSISLSSGVDSGGLISMLSSVEKVSIPSITIGPYGPEYQDLKVAKKVAEYNHSPNHAIYPTIQDLKKMKEYVLGINQPIDSGTLFANSMVFEQAQKIGAPKVIFGFGAEMLLGNLKIARIAHRIALVEKIVPFWILKFIYRVIARIKGFSKNQTEFLLSQSWVDRFLHARGPLLIHEKKYFKKTPVPFVDHYKIEAHRILALPAIGLLDKFVLMYVYSWVNYLQAREFTAMGKKFDAVPVMPFDSIKTMRALFRTPDQFRKLNNWNKQVIRDVFRPYTTPDMYTGRVGSLIIPYNTWFKDTHKPFIDYLRTSKIIMEAVDLDVFERLYETLPEPGLSLMRLLGIALWYDANWDTDNMKNFDAIFPLLTSASQATNLQG